MILLHSLTNSKGSLSVLTSNTPLCLTHYRKPFNFAAIYRHTIISTDCKLAATNTAACNPYATAIIAENI